MRVDLITQNKVHDCASGTGHRGLAASTGWRPPDCKWHSALNEPINKLDRGTDGNNESILNMAEPSTHDRAPRGKGDVRKRTTLNFLRETEVALKLYALRMTRYHGRERSVSIANEHLLYQNPEFTRLLPEARELIDKGLADRVRAYRPGDAGDEAIDKLVAEGYISDPNE